MGERRLPLSHFPMYSMLLIMGCLIMYAAMVWSLSLSHIVQDFWDHKLPQSLKGVKLGLL